MTIPVVKWRQYRWMHFTSLDEERVAWLKKEFEFHDLDLEDSLADKTQRPKWEEHNDHSFFILHFATLDKRDRLVLQELRVFVGKNFLITISSDDFFVGQWFEEAVKGKGEWLKGNVGFLLYLLVDRLTDQGLRLVRKMGRMVDDLDMRMSWLDKKAIEDGSRLRRNLIVYSTALKPMVNIFSKLEMTKVSYLNGKLSNYWGSIADHLSQIGDQLADLSELLDGLNDSFDMLLTQKTNETIRILTIFSVLLLPLTLISSIYGMNVSLPFAGNLMAFDLIVGVMLGSLVLMLGYFWWKKWL